MKKIILLSVLLIMTVILIGCEEGVNKEQGNVIKPVKHVAIREQEIPEAVIRDNTRNQNGITIREIDNRLYETVEELNATKFDRNNREYIRNRRNYYGKMSDAYENALEEIKRSSNQTINGSYQNSLIDYYQNGYDTYNYIYGKYDSFETIEDEDNFMEEVGQAGYRIKENIRRAYDETIDNLGFR